MKIQTLGCLSLILTGCYSSWEPKDADGDGIAGVNDCWESSEDPVVPSGSMIYDTAITAADIFVGAEDRPYDGIDQNCDGLDDFDQDGDGFVPNEYVGIQTLGLDTSGALSGGDCDDEDALRHPDTEELCDGVINGCAAELTNDETDDDGDGFVECSVDANGWQGSDAVVGGDDCDDDDAILFPTQVWYLDADSDEFGDVDNSVVSCAQPLEHVLDNTDCDDEDASIFPSALELCDGLVNACGTELSTDEIDNDGDGYVECAIDAGGWDGGSAIVGGEDCSDQDGTVHVSVTYFADVDEDGFGDSNNSMVACEQPMGFILDDSDCNDDDSTVFPLASELCDGQYNDCSNLFYDATSAPLDELDTDGDAYVACSIDVGGWDGDGNVDGGDDCDPTDANEFPGQVWYADSDGDGFGNVSVSQPACAQPSNTSLDSTDCDDSDATVFPSAPELCDGQVNACGGTLPSDEVDADGDGYSLCALDAGGWDGVGNVVGGGDCDDGSAVTYPGAAFNESSTSCRIDDGDGYGGVSSATSIANGGDCDDSDATIFPSAPELCDGQVNACGGTLPSDEVDSDQDGYVECTMDSNGWDGIGGIAGGGDCDPADVDEFPGQIWYADVDGDGFGDPTSTSTSCFQPSNTSLLSSDCDDSDATVFNNAPELCDGQPNACGTTLAANEIDDDGDGYVECAYNATTWVGASVSGGNDCDDAEALAYPGAAASDSSTACMLDADLDGYGDSSFSTVYSIGSDCVDSDDTVYPNAAELCDGQANACGTALPLVEFDSDGDGYVACELDAGGYDGAGAVLGGGDCAPVGVAGASKHPYADETANDGIDSNCDGMEALTIECEGGTYVSDDGTIEKYFLLCDESEVVALLPEVANTQCVNGGYQGLGSFHSEDEVDFAVDLINGTGTNFVFGRTRNTINSPWVWTDGGTSTYEYSPTTTAGNAGVAQQYTAVRTNWTGSVNEVVDWRVISATQTQSQMPFLCSYTF